MEKLQAMSKYKKNQFLLSSFVLYSLAVFTCTLLCSSPLWFPPLFSSTKSFLFVSIPKIRSFLFNPKCLFVVCNIIIVFLVGESRLMGSSSSSATDIYDEYMKRSQSIQRFSPQEEKKEAKKLERPLIEETIKRVHEDGGGEEDMKRSQSIQRFSPQEEKKEAKKLEMPLIEETIKRRVHEDGGGEEENPERENCFNGEEELDLPADELKQRVEDFIAKFNRQRRLEAEQLM